MKVTIKFLALAVLLVLSPASFAYMPVELVSKGRARELGMEIRSKAAGPNAVRVELEFETKGELKNCIRVDLEIHELSSSTLREDPSKPGRVVVSFAADRTKLDKITLRVVVLDSARERTGGARRLPALAGYEIQVKDFVDLDKVRSDGPKGGDPKEVSFSGKAIHVVLKSQIQLQGRNSTFLFLEQPQIKVFGNSSFVIGRSIEHGRQIWVPLSEVTAIEEFADVKEMGKVYSLPRSREK